jgi:hypothetical protein
LVVVEPPRHALVGRVFKIDNRVFAFAGERFAVEKISGAMRHRLIFDFGVFVKLSAIKFGKKCG